MTLWHCRHFLGRNGTAVVCGAARGEPPPPRGHTTALSGRALTSWSRCTTVSTTPGGSDSTDSAPSAGHPGGYPGALAARSDARRAAYVVREVAVVETCAASSYSPSQVEGTHSIGTHRTLGDQRTLPSLGGTSWRVGATTAGVPFTSGIIGCGSRWLLALRSSSQARSALNTTPSHSTQTSTRTVATVRGSTCGLAADTSTTSAGVKAGEGGGRGALIG